MTTRGKDVDKFWFSLFHELGHIILGHVNKVNGTTENDEQAADQFARDTLINPEDFNHFKDKKSYSEKSVVSFADTIEIDPGIVVGRMQKEELIKYSSLNHLKKQYDMTLIPAK